MALAGFGNPNCELLKVVFQLGKVTWLSALVASTRNSRPNRSVTWKTRPRDAFRLNWEGPVMEFLPALPHWPGGGAAYAAGFRKSPAGALWSGAPVYSGRMLPVTPVPATARKSTGVR